MKVFDHPNMVDGKWACTICETAKDEPVILVPIAGTDVDGTVEAEQIHMDCILHHLVLHKLENNENLIGFSYMRPPTIELELKEVEH
jgi:hypothetical protein